MKKTSSKLLTILCVFALICTLMWVAFYAIQSYFVLTTGSGYGVINWGSPNMGGKLTMFVINRLLIITLAGLMAAFVFNILKHLKGGTIFNRANVVLLWIMAIVLPIHSFISDNMGFACSAVCLCDCGSPGRHTLQVGLRRCRGAEVNHLNPLVHYDYRES